MTRPAASSRLTLVEDRRGGPAAPGSAPLRRYRLARVRLGEHSSHPERRFDYLKRTYD
jgi:hypothetical protein